MLSLRAHAVICAVLFGLLIGIPILGNVLQASGVTPPPGGPLLAFQIFYFTLFLAFGLSAIPVMVMVVLRPQQGVAAAPIAAMVRNQTKIIWALWILILAGAVIAVPAAIQGGLFDQKPAAPQGTSPD
jgi:uncharacterized membrane protein YGL010W